MLFASSLERQGARGLEPDGVSLQICWLAVDRDAGDRRVTDGGGSYSSIDPGMTVPT